MEILDGLLDYDIVESDDIALTLDDQQSSDHLIDHHDDHLGIPLDLPLDDGKQHFQRRFSARFSSLNRLRKVIGFNKGLTG